MRLWSIHPEYLDSKGLTACWREGLLARKVLQGQTKGYKNHPQLIRFKNMDDPIETIDYYLLHILDEANKRGYRFDASKITFHNNMVRIPVTNGQIEYEFDLLKKKLMIRNKEALKQIQETIKIIPHPLFFVVDGNVEQWEKQ